MNYKKFLGATSAALLIVIAIFMLTPGAWAQSKYKTLYKFKGGKDGNGAFAGLIFDLAGNLYGTTVYGGANNAGTVFELTPTSTGGWTQSVLYSFDCADGCNPQSESLIFDGAGNLYGMTPGGGLYGRGVVFELTPTSSGLDGKCALQLHRRRGWIWSFWRDLRCGRQSLWYDVERR